MDDTQMQRVENLMKEMDLILESSNEEYKNLVLKKLQLIIFMKNLEKIQEAKKKLFKKETNLKSKLKKI